MRVVSFGSYTFAHRLSGFNANFANLVPRTMRLPGMDGGYDEMGDDAPPSEIGRVQIQMRYNATSGSAMQQTRDDLRGLAALGRQVLVIEPSGGTATRWANAKINNVGISERMAAITDKVQEVSLDFQVADARWYSDNAASGTVAACSGTATDFSRANAGNATSRPVITLVAGTAALTAGATIKRLVGTVVADRIVYSGTVAAGGTLVVDCRALSVKIGGVDSYGTAFSADHPAWLRLEPGSNDYRVELAAGKTANVTFEWDDTWY